MTKPISSGAGSDFLVYQAVGHRVEGPGYLHMAVEMDSAGAGCDGQVRVVNDILGSYTGYIPKHAKQYAKLRDIMSSAFSQYREEVTTDKFPTEANSFPMDESILAGLE